MKLPWLAALLNFFTLGLGTIINGKRIITGLLLFIGGGLLAYLEMGLLKPLADQTPYWYSFAGFFALAIAMAVDGWNEAKMINEMKKPEQH